MKTRPSFINDLDWRLLLERYPNEKKLERIVKRLENDYPVQYAIGDVEFMKNKIFVNSSVLIPRFETELLVSKLNDFIKKYDLLDANILDMCTGSGCIAIALKKEFNRCNVFALDKSFKALRLAKKNAKYNKVSISFKRRDIFKKIRYKNKFFVLVSNPPYVKLDEYVSPNTKYEPKMALYPGKDDIAFYKRILDISKDLLYKKNIIAFEIGESQASRICKYAKEIYKDAEILVLKDYAGFDRFVFIFNNCE